MKNKENSNPIPHSIKWEQCLDCTLIVHEKDYEKFLKIKDKHNLQVFETHTPKERSENSKTENHEYAFRISNVPVKLIKYFEKHFDVWYVLLVYENIRYSSHGKTIYFLDDVGQHFSVCTLFKSDFKESSEYKINWGACGDQDTETTIMFVKAINLAVRIAKEFNSQIQSVNHATQ